MKSEDPRDDVALLEAWRVGDERAGAVLFDRYFDAMHRFFRNKVDRGVEDLVQQTFLACVRNKESFRAAASFRTYLYTIARSRLYDALRKKRRLGGETDLASRTLAELRTSPSTRLVKQEEQRMLHDALETLPLELHLAIELFYFEELPAREVALALGIPEGTVRSRLRRALDKLRNQLATGGGPAARRTLAGLDALASRRDSEPG